MSAHPQPVPPDQRSPMGQQTGASDAGSAKKPDLSKINLAEQGRQGNGQQNTTNKGLQ